VATLYADRLMNLTPWALWDTATGEPAAGAATLEAKAVLDQALAGPEGQAHPGILHMYIHLMEMSARPADALQAGDLLVASSTGPIGAFCWASAMRNSAASWTWSRS